MKSKVKAIVMREEYAVHMVVKSATIATALESSSAVDEEFTQWI